MLFYIPPLQLIHGVLPYCIALGSFLHWNFEGVNTTRLLLHRDEAPSFSAQIVTPAELPLADELQAQECTPPKDDV